MKHGIAIALFILGVFGALYISVWWGIVQPVYSLCKMADAHTLTAMDFAGEFLKFIVRDIIAIAWLAVCWLSGMFCIRND